MSDVFSNLNKRENQHNPLGLAALDHVKTPDGKTGLILQLHGRSGESCIVSIDEPNTPRRRELLYATARLVLLEDDESHHTIEQNKTCKVVEAVCADLLRRSQLGIDKYGFTLSENPHGHDKRYWLQHAYEEALDLANYLKCELMRIEKGST